MEEPEWAQAEPPTRIDEDERPHQSRVVVREDDRHCAPEGVPQDQGRGLDPHRLEESSGPVAVAEETRPLGPGRQGGGAAEAG